MTITEIKKAVEKLSINEQQELFEWVDELRENQWDKQIENDLDNGRLNKLIEQKKKNLKKGSARKFK